MAAFGVLIRWSEGPTLGRFLSFIDSDRSKILGASTQFPARPSSSVSNGRSRRISSRCVALSSARIGAEAEQSRADICEIRAVTAETLRGQIKKIYAKTGTEGEAELMRLLVPIMA